MFHMRSLLAAEPSLPCDVHRLLHDDARSDGEVVFALVRIGLSESDANELLDLDARGVRDRLTG